MQTRRQFISQTSTVAGGFGLGLTLGPRLFAQGVGANDQVVLGLIGCGGMGRADLQQLMRLKGVEVAAVCDVDESHIKQDVANHSDVKHCISYEREYRKPWHLKKYTA